MNIKELYNKLQKEPFKELFGDTEEDILSNSLNKSINSWKVGIGTASKDFSDWLISFLKNNNYRFSIEKRKIKNGIFYNITLCGIMGKIFLDNCYEKVSDIAHPRKYEKYLELCNVKFKYNYGLN